MCIYIYVFMCVYIYICTYIYIYTYLNTCILYMYTYIYIAMCVYGWHARGFGASEPLRFSEANNALGHTHSTEVKARISPEKFEFCITCFCVLNTYFTPLSRRERS